MRQLRAVLLRLSGLFRKNKRDAEFSSEIESHLQMHIDENLRAGMSREEARRQALIMLGGIEQTKVLVRERRGLPMLEVLLQDLRFAGRTLRRNPGFTSVAVLTLALGVGANTALFSVVKAVLLNSLPYRQPERLVTLARGDSQTPNPTNVSYGETEDWKDRTRSFQQIALYHGWTPSSSAGGAPEMVFGLRVTRNFFETLGTSPYLGRGFLPDEDRPGRWHVVLLSYPYWIRRFGGDPNAIGRTILLDQLSFQIVGVLPQSFEPLSFTTDASSPPDVWVPLGYDRSLPNACRTCQHLRAVARLNDGVSLGQVRAEMHSIASQLAQEFPKDYPPDAAVVVLPLRESWYGNITTALWLLFGATALVLLIACANVANLLLTQALKKRSEIALRSALGASRFRIVRQLLTESILLSLVAATGGVLLAFWGTPLLLKWAPAEIPVLKGVHFDLGILLFTLGITAATGILMGLVPALATSPGDHLVALQQSPRALRGPSRGRTRGFLVSSQVCLAFVLTVASGLLLKSFVLVWRVNPGFNVQNLYEVNFSLSGTKYENDKAIVRAQTEVLGHIRQIPGVESAGLTSTPPIAGSFGGFDQSGFIVQDRRIPDSQVPSVDRYIVSPGYFPTMEIPLLRGRLFTEAEAAGSYQVAIISEMTARQFFPGENPLGKRIQLGARQDDRPWAEIIGIVGDVHQYGLDSPATPQAYLLYSQFPFNYATVLFARSTIAPAALTRAMDEQIRAVDKDTLVFNPALMTEILSHSLAQRRFTMALLSAFGALALLLAAVGIYGVMSYMVAQRTGEIGIRMALGAQKRDILELVSRDGMLRTGFGLLAGLLVSLVLARVLTSQLFAVSALDPLTFGEVLLLLAGVALLACYVPARRAARVDPMAALRYE
jgi:putative ABC transport system permease protein